jgi:hypothetical protein
MQDFTRPSGRLRALPWGARVVYSIFLAFTLIAMILTLVLTDDMVGLDMGGVATYYQGEAAPVDNPDNPTDEDGPELLLPPDGEQLAAFEPMSRRKLLEVTHFHLFSMPVYLLILSHLFMLSRARPASKAVWIGLASFATALHVAAPWLAATGSPGSVAVYAVSGAIMVASYSVMGLGPLWEMWRS